MTTSKPWFYLEAGAQQGPLDQQQLVDRLLGEAKPGLVSVWREGLPEWIAAEAVPELALELKSARSYFYLGADGSQQGPVEMPQLVSLLRSAKVLPSASVWRRGMAEWQPAGTVPEIAARLGGAPAAVGPAAPAASSAPVARAGAPLAARASASAAAASTDPIFDRDKFLLRQKYLSIQQKYEVWDEQGQAICFVTRQMQHLRTLLAIAGAIGTLTVTMGVFIALSAALDSGWPVLLGFLVAFPATMVVGVALSPKRHVQFFRDKEGTQQVLEVLQDQKWAWLVWTYTLRDASGTTIAHFKKNMLTDLFRKKWTVWAPDGRLICVAKEDSVLKAILRRVLTNLIKMNFIFLRGDTEEQLGSFNRRFTLLDRYVLDMTADPARLIDRRIALALGVLLDTGERR
ncbi:MAG TPA: DUF4339 domain-containing protein [Vicinamibacteria bacterium]|nr:DUF4339 domain-containing protein [Vicinamibacteria bacterium]